MIFRLRAPLLAFAALAVGGMVAAADLVSIEGLQSVPASQARTWIASQLKFVESAGVSRARADDLAFFLENAMREQGYSDATVDWKIVGEGEAARILLTASEGSSLVVGNVSVEGNVALEDAAVIELLTSATVKRLKKEPGETLPYVKQDIEQGRGKVVSFYKLLGFRNAKVDLEKEIEELRRRNHQNL
jgi:outer membrane protein assembly factor BamA